MLRKAGDCSKRNIVDICDRKQKCVIIVGLLGTAVEMKAQTWRTGGACRRKIAMIINV
jgi:hypothetical protein